MERDQRQEALRELLELATVKGYVTFDDVFNYGTDFSLSLVLHFFSLSVNRYKKSRIQEHHAEKLSCGFLMHHFSDKMEIAPP